MDAKIKEREKTDVKSKEREKIDAKGKASREYYIATSCKEVFQTQPKIYKAKLLEVFKDEETRLRKVEVGPRPERRRENKVILTIGETGSGKTTLLNALYNFITRIEYEDKFRLKLIDEEQNKTQAESQTKWITAYTIHHQPWFDIPYTITVIDTPGFGDTGGIQRDKEIMKQISSFFSTAKSHEMKRIHMVGFVASAAQPRLTAPQHYVLESVLSVFGKDIEENINMMLTFTDANKPQIISALKKAKIPYQQYFKFNNSELFEKYPDADDKDAKMISEITWKNAFKNFGYVMKELGTVTSKTLDLSKQVVQKRHELEMVAARVQRNIYSYLHQLQQCKNDKETLKTHQIDIEQQKSFTFPAMKEVVTKVPSTYRATNCKICKQTCHRNCWAFLDILTFTCSAIEGVSACKVCRCGTKQHTNEKFTYETKFIEVTQTSEELVNKYIRMATKGASHEDIVAVCQGAIEKAQNDSVEAIKEGLECSNQLKSIALRPITQTVVEYIDILIEKEVTGGSSQMIRQLRQIQQISSLMLQISKFKTTGEEDSSEGDSDAIQKKKQ